MSGSRGGGARTPGGPSPAAYKAKAALRIAYIGDSITANAQSSIGTLDGIGYPTWTNIYAGHRFVLTSRDATHYFFATGGYKTTDVISAGYDVAAAASTADVVVVHIGTNDVGAATGLADAAGILVNLQTIWNTLLAAGKTVVATTVLPRNNADAAGITACLHELNHLIRAYVPSVPGMVLCDWNAQVLDPATGLGSASYLADGIHPNAAGASKLGAFLAATLVSLTPAAPPTVGVTLGVRGLTLNPYGTGTGGSPANTPTSWNAYTLGAPTSLTYSKVARTDGVAGEWSQAVCAAATATTDGTQFQVFKSGGFAIGEQYVGIAEVQVDATAYDLRKLSISCFANATSTSTVEVNMNAGASPLSRPAGTIWLVTPPLTLTSAASNVQVNVYAVGSFTLRVGRMQVVRVS